MRGGLWKRAPVRVSRDCTKTVANSRQSHHFITSIDGNKNHSYLEQLLFRVQSGVKPSNTNVLLSSTLLRFDQTGCAVNADNETSCDLGIQSTAVTRLLAPKNSFDPSNNFVRRRVRRLVQIDDAVFDIVIKRTFQWRTTIGNRCVMTRPHIQLLIVLSTELKTCNSSSA
jgi:hypothetical protein